MKSCLFTVREAVEGEEEEEEEEEEEGRSMPSGPTERQTPAIGSRCTVGVLLLLLLVLLT